MPVAPADVIAIGRGARGFARGDAARPADALPRWLIAAALPVWLAVAALSIWLEGANVAVALPDSDDAMRLVEVRDLLAGQPWYDLVQHRLGAEPGILMHWSRLIDAPIAALILVLRPVLGPDEAERVALTVWPLVPALLLLPCAALIGDRLAGRWGGALALASAAGAVPLVRHFAPGRIDHHNAQLALTMALVAALTSMARARRAALVAGIVSALMLAVGVETLPYVAFGGVAVLLGWWRHGPERTRAVLDYFAGFAAAATIAMAVTVSPARWLTPACDFVSPIYLAPLWVSFAVAVAGAHWRIDERSGGIALLIAAMGLLAATSVAAIDSACLKGPFGNVDPMLFPLWMDHVAEARPALSLVRSQPGVALAVFAAPVLTLVLVLLAWKTFVNRTAATVATGMLALAAGLALFQVRTLPFAAMLAAPLVAGAAAAVVARGWRITLDPIWGYAIAAMVANPLALTLTGAGLAQGLGIRAPANATAAQTSDAQCTRRTEYRGLAALPPGLVVGMVAFGPYMLAETPHRILAGPYHRNRDGIVAATEAFTSAPARAREILRASGADYLAFCSTSAEFAELLQPGDDTLLAGLKRGEPPAWLDPVPDRTGAATRIYRVKRD